MDDFSSRLAWARAEAGYKSPRAAAEELGWNPNTYKSHEGGIRAEKRPPEPETVRKYARAFRVDFVWLMTGEGSPGVRNLVKVVGYIGAGAQIEPQYEQAPEDGLFEIEADIPLPAGMIGFEVKGDSMLPRYDEGDVIIVSAEGVLPSDIQPDEEAAVRTETGQRYLKKVVPTGKAFDLLSHNASPIRGVSLLWASPVYIVIRARRWRRMNDAHQKAAPAVKRRR